MIPYSCVICVKNRGFSALLTRFVIDWLTAHIDVPDTAVLGDWGNRAGYTLYARPGGAIDHVTPAWLPVAGSYDSAIRLRPSVHGLWVSGNPAKFLTGQNLDGPDSAPALLAVTLRFVARALGLPAELADWPTRLTRVDVTRGLDLGSVERVRQALWVLGIVARAERQGRAARSRSTVYFGKHSTRHSVKCYCKADELASHPPSLLLPPALRSDLEIQAAGCLRIEVTIRGQQLKQDKIDGLAAWADPALPERIWARYWGAVEMAEGYRLDAQDMMALPAYLRATYALWAAGGDCAQVLAIRSYYRHRRGLLAATAGRVDIAVIQPAAAAGTSSDPDGMIALLKSAPRWRCSDALAEWIGQCVA